MPDPVAVAPADHAVTVVLDLMCPLRTVGHGFGERRKHGGDEASGQVASSGGHGREVAT